MDSKLELTTLGGGCFWCLEAFYQRVKGIEKVDSGYSGGYVENPTYEQVSAGKTGHAEVVQLSFDPKVISYREILEIFFVMHNPTTLNRQGNDVGEQYRSIILYHNDEQKKIAEQTAKDFAKPLYKDPVVTQIEPYTRFYPAEPEHIDYYKRNPNAGYCLAVIDPKIQKLRSEFAAKLKPA